MNDLKDKIVGWLFQTGAVRVSPAEKPFWYTSGLIGPYYVNTHFLYGSEQKAVELLALIDRNKNDLEQCTMEVRQAVLANYEQDGIYRPLIDGLVEYIRQNIPLEQVDCIAGGERRDWFFSLLPAEILGLPHLVISKDRQVVMHTGEDMQPTDLKGKRVLHISDLITEASSYVRAWIPAVQEQGASMPWTVTIVDRKQGGQEALASAGVEMHALVSIDEDLFLRAKRQGYLSDEQYQLVMGYLADPFESMRQFLLRNPAFLADARNADSKTRERATRLLEQDLYKLDGEKN